MALPAGRRGVRPDQVNQDGSLVIPEPTPYELPIAASGTLGGIKVGDRLSIDSETGVLSADTQSIPMASASTLGGIKVGDRLTINSETGALSADEQSIPVATDSALGGVKVGTGLSVTEDGTLSAAGGGKVYLHIVHVGVVGTNCDEMFAFYSSDNTPLVTGELFRGYLQSKGFINKDKILPAIGKNNNGVFTVGIYARSATSSDTRCFKLKNDFSSTDVWEIGNNAELTDNVFEM